MSGDCDLLQSAVSLEFRQRTGLCFEWIEPVRWWQVWRWPWIVTRDYHVSRACEAMRDSVLRAVVSMEVARRSEITPPAPLKKTGRKAR